MASIFHLRRKTLLNSQSGEPMTSGSSRGLTPPTVAGSIPARLEEPEPLAHRRGEHPPVIALLELLDQRSARQRVDRIVEVDEQFAPGDAEHVVGQLERRRARADGLGRAAVSERRSA